MIRHINDVLDVNFNEYSRRFPAFFYVDERGRKTKPVIIPAQAIAADKTCPMYFRRLIDVGTLAGDPYYLLFNADPLRGDASRERAVEFFGDFMYGKLGLKSSFDVESGMTPTEEYPMNGTMDREEAIDAEVLPARNDGEYRRYYEEQLAKARGDENERRMQDFEKKHGFRPDDPDIIDVSDDNPEATASGTAVGKAADTAVGRPNKIWYGVDLHIPSTGTRLGYNGRGGRVGGSGRHGIGGPGGGIRRLREDELDAMLQEAVDGASVAAKLDELIAMVEPGSGLQAALLDIKDKFALSECDACGDPACKDGEICGLNETVLSQDDRDEIADMFAGYSGGGSSLGVSRSALDGFMTAHAAELQRLRKGQASGLGDFSAARDLGSDDETPNEQYESEEDIEKEIAGIVNEGENEDESETEKLIKEYGDVEDDVEEDEDELSESVIRHANMLAREVW